MHTWHNQNPNERINHSLWERLQKKFSVSSSTLNLCVLDAVTSFNDAADDGK